MRWRGKEGGKEERKRRKNGKQGEWKNILRECIEKKGRKCKGKKKRKKQNIKRRKKEIEAAREGESGTGGESRKEIRKGREERR